MSLAHPGRPEGVPPGSAPRTARHCSFSLQTPDEGAWTSVYAAVSPELEGLGGRYLYNEQETKSLDVTYDRELQRELWARSCRMAGIADVTPGAVSH